MSTTLATIDLTAIIKEGAGRDLLKSAHNRIGSQQRLLMKRYELTASEAALFLAILADTLDDRKGDLRKLAKRHRIAGGDYIKLFKIHTALVAKNILLTPDDGFGKDSTLNPPCLIDGSILKAIIHGEEADGAIDPTDPFSLLQEIEGLWDKLGERDISPDRFSNESKRLLRLLDAADPLRELTDPLPFVEQMMLLVAAINTAGSSRSGVDLQTFATRLFPKLRARATFLRTVTEGQLTSLDKGLLVLVDDHEDPFSTSPDFTLTPSARNRLFGAQNKNKKKKLHLPPFFSHHPASKKGPELFFDAELSAELDTVARTLSCAAGGRRAFTRRLKERGLPIGFTALFHGGPGTGKTASVHYLSRLVKRDILQVEMSAMRDRWVGESEKRTRAIFTEYQAACESLPVTPILLLNEADALLSHRIHARDSVDAMHNTMQNILLEELEKFDGILFATTNLTGMLDDAFSRRFLYKLAFPVPSPALRARIWRSKLPELDDAATALLATHPLSGGEIENVTRRYIVDTLFSGKPDLARLETLCREELSLKEGMRRKMGF